MYLDSSASGETVSKTAHWGATIVATLVAVIVLFVTAIVIGGLFAFIQYWMSSMRAEAAIFIGVLVGGGVGTYSARAACDAIFKSYSRKTIFVVLICLAAGALALEAHKGFDWSSASRLGQWAVILITGWTLFWNEEEI